MELKKSLITLKNDLAQKEEIQNTIYHNYPHLIQLSQKQLCIYFEINTLTELIHIQKHVINIHDTNENICKCLDSEGNIKDLYISKSSAKKQTHFSQVKLIVYPCPNTKGWHLSKY